MTNLIREPSDDDFSVWRSLWEGYLEFYETSLPAMHANHLWARIRDSSDPIECRLAENDGEVIGLVHFLPHSDTWRKSQVCYLQDLFVDAGHRGSGVGEDLIRAVQERGREVNWSNIYWLTAEDNESARGLYDKITGGANGFVVYELDPEG